MRQLLTAIAALAILGGSAAAQPGPPNMDFEQGPPGAAPPEWRFASKGFEAVLDTTGPHEGAQSVRLERRADAVGAEQFGTVSRSIDATPYRGQRIRFRAAVKVRPAPGQKAGLWLRVDRTGGQPGFLDNMGNRPIKALDWTVYEIVAPVGADAERIVFGALQTGSGALWMDSASIESLGPCFAGEPAAPLTARGRENLEAFARLYGYVRWFHPSREAISADWDAVAIAGVQKAEGARDAAALAAALREVFLPLAPTLIIEPGAAPPPPVPSGLRYAWTHTGLQTPQHGLYRSNVAPAPADFGPDETVALDLGQGVTARMRLSLPRDAAAATLAPVKPDKPDGFMANGDDRTTRLAVVIAAWNVAQHFYPYFDVVQVDWRAQLGPALEAAAADKDSAAFQTTLRRLMAALADGHARVESMQDAATAPLPFAWGWVEDRLTILTVAQDGDSVKPGDIVERINGRDAAQVLAEYEALASSAGPQRKRWYATRLSARGVPGAPVQLTVRRSDGSFAEIRSAYRGQAELPTEQRPPAVAELRPGLMYLDIQRVGDAEYRAALPRLAAARAVIFDFRGYPTDFIFADLPTHLSRTPISSAWWGMPIYTRPDRKGLVFRDRQTTKAPADPFFPGKLVFLTNASAMSRPEAVLSYPDGNAIGVIVGSPTSGANGDVTAQALPGGYVMRMTGMRVLRQDRSVQHGVGIIPTVPAARTLKGVREGRDEELEKAIAVAGF